MLRNAKKITILLYYNIVIRDTKIIRQALKSVIEVKLILGINI